MFTAVVDAPPVISCVAGITCFMSNATTLFAGILTVGTILTELKAIVAVDDVAAVFERTIFVTTALEPAGVVYKVVPVFVVAAVLASALVVVAIISYSFLVSAHK